MSPNDFSNETNPFGTFQEIEIGMGLARAHRVTYVGELGWELYVSTDQAAHVFEAIEEAGADLGLKLCGLHTLDSCRIEKAFRHFGHDITDEDHVLEAGLGFAVKTGKGDFIGRDAVLKKRDAGLNAPAGAVPAEATPSRCSSTTRRSCATARSSAPSRRAITAIISAARSAWAMCPAQGESEADVLASSYEIEIAGERFAAEASLKPMYDPKAERVQDVGRSAPQNAATFRLTSPETPRGFRRRGVHQVVRQDTSSCSAWRRARGCRAGWSCGRAGRSSNDHQRGAPQVVIDADLPDMRHQRRDPAAVRCSAKAMSFAQTRSNQPFSMAGSPYHQVG